MTVRPVAAGGSAQRRAGAAAGWVGFSLAFALRAPAGAPRLTVLVVALSAALLAIGVLGLSRRRTKLTLVGDQLVYTGLIGRRVSRRGDGRVVDIDILWGGPSRRRSRLWLLIDDADRTVVSLNLDAWDEDELEELRRKLGIPVEAEEAPQSPRLARRRYPGSVPLWAAHPVVVTISVICVFALLVIALP